jgi:hypothetical protein
MTKKIDAEEVKSLEDISKKDILETTLENCLIIKVNRKDNSITTLSREIINGKKSINRDSYRLINNKLEYSDGKMFIKGEKGYNKRSRKLKTAGL